MSELRGQVLADLMAANNPAECGIVIANLIERAEGYEKQIEHLQTVLAEMHDARP